MTRNFHCFQSPAFRILMCVMRKLTKIIICDEVDVMGLYTLIEPGEFHLLSITSYTTLIFILVALKIPIKMIILKRRYHTHTHPLFLVISLILNVIPLIRVILKLTGWVGASRMGSVSVLVSFQCLGLLALLYWGLSTLACNIKFSWKKWWAMGFVLPFVSSLVLPSLSIAYLAHLVFWYFFFWKDTLHYSEKIFQFVNQKFQFHDRFGTWQACGDEKQSQTRSPDLVSITNPLTP